MFIAGKERLFASGNPPRNTLIGIHGAHDKATRQVSPQLTPQMYALYKSRRGDKFDADVINQALYKIKDAGGLLRVRELARTKPAEQVPCAPDRCHVPERNLQNPWQRLA